MTVSDYFFVVLAFDEVRDLRKLIRSYNCKFKCVKRHFISHELLQLGSKFYLVFLAQLLNLNNPMKIFLRVLNASVQKTLNFLPLCMLLTEKKFWSDLGKLLLRFLYTETIPTKCSLVSRYNISPGR